MSLMWTSSPQNIQIVVNADAGKFFYGQIIENKIFHLDVFHQCGKENHHQAAKKVIETIKYYGKYSLQKANLPNPDLFDIQTGTGGGRITGSLTYGTKESLCYTHQNHIHLAFSLSHEHLVLLFYLVETLEKVILNSLRLGDIVCKYSMKQFLILLDCDENGVVKAINRIKKDFLAQDKYERVSIDYSYAAIAVAKMHIDDEDILKLQ